MDHNKEKVDRRVLYTKMFLKESLLSLMKDKPIAKITPSELCRHAGINRNTFYAHFDSPEALLASIEKELYDELKQIIEPSLKNETISTLLTEIFQVIYENRELCSIIFSKNGTKDSLRHIIDFAYDKTVVEWRAAGMRKDEEQAEMLYQFVVNGNVAIIQRWIQEGMVKSPQEVALFIEKATHFGLQAFLSK
jgi:AcrR family transcriptional regulator